MGVVAKKEGLTVPVFHTFCKLFTVLGPVIPLFKKYQKYCAHYIKFSKVPFLVIIILKECVCYCSFTLPLL